MKKEPLRILLADDDAADRLLFQEAFEELKIKSIVETVNDGFQLMDHLARENTLLPHLLFLDLNMPQKSGLECLKEIRDNDRFRKISIAIFSTSSSPKDIENTFANGANVYIRKPSDFNLLKKVLGKAVTSANYYQEFQLNINNFIMLSD